MQRWVAADLRRPGLGAWVAVWLGIIGAAAVGQEAPPDLPFAIRNAPTLSDENRKNIDRYIDYWAGQLTAAPTANGVNEAKDRLASLVEGNPSKVFREAYSAAVGRALEPAAKSEKLQVRLAAMIVAGGASSGAVAPICVSGLGDPNVGVRYQAAKAVADVMERRVITEPPPFTPEQQQAILKALNASMAGESSELAYQQMGRAITRLTLPEAFPEAIRRLDERLTWVRRRPDQGPRAARDMMQNMVLGLLARAAMSEDKNIEAPLRELVTQAGRYLQALAEVIESKGPSPEAQPYWEDLVVEIETDVLRRAIERLAPGTTGPSLMTRVKRGQWPEMADDIKKWVGLLSSTAIAIPADRLALPPLAQGPAERVPAQAVAAPGK